MGQAHREWSKGVILTPEARGRKGLPGGAAPMPKGVPRKPGTAPRALMHRATSVNVNLCGIAGCSSFSTSTRTPTVVGIQQLISRILVGGLALVGAAIAQAEPTLQDARQLWLAGKYAEADAAFQTLADREPAAVAGRARCLQSTGKRGEAESLLTAALATKPDAVDLRAAMAELCWAKGDLAGAQQHVDAVLAADANNLSARWLAAELHRVHGRLGEALDGYRWFVDFYNNHDEHSAESLVSIGRGAAQYARWKRVRDQFSFLVNELYPDAWKLDPTYWPARYEAGLLFLEKYNNPDADKELRGAIELNPNAAEAYAGLARLALQGFELEAAHRALDRALEINPELVDAYLYRADAFLANFQTAQAVEALEKALALNPVSEATLGRLAAALAVRDGIPADPAGTRFGEIVDQATARNPHAGEFFLALATGLDLCRKYPAAARYYRESLDRMPQLVETRGALGLMYMRLGDEVAAKTVLDEAFAVDPFNIRVSNTLQVLEVLEGYAVLETEHFVLRFDRGQDQLLAKYAARYLERDVYPQLVKELGFEPPEKSLFEIFNKAKNTNGHGWFSARMVGLPYIGTVGACAGKMVALASPNDLPKKYNWARVLKHEFVHVLNLQQTEFNIPHWYTEALAVQSEGYPRPRIWDELLAARVPKGELFDLDNINLGFIRPASGLDWQMAYCQSQLYAQYMLKQYGDDALLRMLSAYRDNLGTAAALRRCFQVEQADFERGYREFLAQVAAGLTPAGSPPGPPAGPARSAAQLRRALEKDPENPDLLAAMAMQYLARRRPEQAKELAEKALAKHPKHPAACLAMARACQAAGQVDRAVQLLEAALDPAAPDIRMLGLLGELKLQAGDAAQAIELLQQGAKLAPANPTWNRLLADAYGKTGDVDKQLALLERLAEQEADDFAIRMRLAQAAFDKRDFAAAAHWAEQAVYVDVLDPAIHRLWGDALAAQNDHAAAIDELETALTLDPNLNSARMSLARVYAAAKQPAKARETLQTLLAAEPDHPGAAELLESLPREP